MPNGDDSVVVEPAPALMHAANPPLLLMTMATARPITKTTATPPKMYA